MKGAAPCLGKGAVISSIYCGYLFRSPFTGDFEAEATLNAAFPVTVTALVFVPSYRGCTARTYRAVVLSQLLAQPLQTCRLDSTFLLRARALCFAFQSFKSPLFIHFWIIERNQKGNIKFPTPFQERERSSTCELFQGHTYLLFTSILQNKEKRKTVPPPAIFMGKFAASLLPFLSLIMALMRSQLYRSQIETDLLSRSPVIVSSFCQGTNGWGRGLTHIKTHQKETECPKPPRTGTAASLTVP